ncbi:type IV pilus assembly protein PilM [bacterium]|nr:type IV pilus assembly protein PilM [bacterium]
MRFLDTLLKKQLVGLDIGISGIKAIEVSSEKAPRLLAYNRIPLNWDTISVEGEVKDRNALIQALKKLFAVGNFSSKNVSVSAFGRSIISKRISIPVMTEEELDHQLYWEAEQYIPFNTDEVNLDFAILGPNTQTLAQEPKMDVLLVAAKKDFIKFLQSLIKEAGLNPVVIDTQAFALGNVFEFNYHSWLREQGCSTSVLIDFGASSTKISVVEGQQTTFNRDIQLCGTRCTEMIMEQLGVTVEDAERLKIEKAFDPTVTPILVEFSNMLADEILKTIDFFLSQATQQSIDAVFTCGGGVNLSGLNQVLKDKLPAPVYLLNPLKHIIGTGRQVNQIALQEIAYLGAVAAGLSLRKQGDH